MDRAQQLFIQIREKRGDQFRRRVAVNGVHVDRDSRRLGVGAMQQLDAGNRFVAEFGDGHFAVIARENFIERAAFLLSHHDRRQKTIPLDRVLERRHLAFGEILRVALQRHELIETQDDQARFCLRLSRSAQKSSVPSPGQERHSTIPLAPPAPERA